MNTVFFQSFLGKKKERSVKIFHVLKLFQTHSGHVGIRRRFFRSPFTIFWNLGEGGTPELSFYDWYFFLHCICSHLLKRSRKYTGWTFLCPVCRLEKSNNCGFAEGLVGSSGIPWWTPLFNSCWDPRPWLLLGFSCGSLLTVLRLPTVMRCHTAWRSQRVETTQSLWGCT